MNIDRMRFIDQGIGVPLCWLMTQLYRLGKLFTKSPVVSESPRRILFLKPAEMGTSIILYPTVAKAKELYPEAELYFVAFEENVAIFKVLQMIPAENILTIRTESFFTVMGDSLKVIAKLRRLKIDVVIDLEFFSRYTALFSFLTGAPKRVGFHRFYSEGLYRGELMTHKVAYNYYLHVGQSFMSLLFALKYPPSRIALQEVIPFNELKVPKLTVSAEARTKIIEKLRSQNPSVSDKSKLVVMSPNTGEWLPYRKWPVEYYADLAKNILAASADTFVIVTGTHSAIQDAEYLVKHVADNRLINLVCGTSFSEFIDLVGISKVVVSVDSGPAHFACLTNAGIVCIFGPDTKTVFAPLSRRAVSIECGLACHPCFSVFNARRPNCDDKDKPCLRSISVQRVQTEVEKFLREPATVHA